MKRIALTVVSLMLVTKTAFGFVFLAPLPLLWIAAAGGGAVVAHHYGQKPDGDSMAKDAGISRFEGEHLESIRMWTKKNNNHNVIRHLPETAQKLRNFRDSIEQAYGLNAEISSIKGLTELLKMDLPINGRMKTVDGTLTVAEFFGTSAEPLYSNLANTAHRLVYICNTSWHKADCQAMMQ